MKYLNSLLEKFFIRWKQKYLPALREHTRVKKCSVKRSANVEDIVTIHKEKQPQQKWSIGKFTRLILVARGAELIMTDKSGKVITISRLLEKLYPLEVQDTSHDNAEESICIENEQEPRITQAMDKVEVFQRV